MEIKDIESKLNIGIPCYNRAFFNLQYFTLKCYKKGSGGKAIGKERELRNESKRVLEKDFNFKILDQDDGFYHYISTGANTQDSNTKFGFDDTSKLCSIFNCTKDPSIYDETSNEESKLLTEINDSNIDKIIEERINKSSKNSKLNELYNLKNKLLSYDFKDLEEQYFFYLDDYFVTKTVLEQYCINILYLLSNKQNIIAQEYMFLLSAYLKNYGNIDLNINGSNTTLKDFTTSIKNEYGLKDEYLLREGFTPNSMEYNENIINSIINKQNIELLGELCKSGEGEPNYSSENYISVEPMSEEEIKLLEQILTDRKLFYLGLNPIGEIECHGAFKKYGAFVYKNGIIVADAFNINTIKALKENAIYKFNSMNFDVLKDLSKQALVGKKMYHTDTWKKRAKKYIEQETNPELHEKAKELVKKDIIV